jgi:indole-3-glycerol phosphate synthase
VQASRTWVPPGGTLGRILEQTRQRLPSLDSSRSDERPPVGQATREPLRSALRRESVAIIAELKRRSPSKGTLNDALGPKQTAEFERGGAAAISVLTEMEFFGGSMDDLVAVRDAVTLPILKKDFHVHASQLLEARNLGASGVLLIARALSPDELPRMMREARDLSLEAVIEVRSETELERAMEAGAEIIESERTRTPRADVEQRAQETACRLRSSSAG